MCTRIRPTTCSGSSTLDRVSTSNVKPAAPSATPATDSRTRGRPCRTAAGYGAHRTSGWTPPRRGLLATPPPNPVGADGSPDTSQPTGLHPTRTSCYGGRCDRAGTCAVPVRAANRDHPAPHPTRRRRPRALPGVPNRRSARYLSWPCLLYQAASLAAAARFAAGLPTAPSPLSGPRHAVHAVPHGGTPSTSDVGSHAR